MIVTDRVPVGLFSLNVRPPVAVVTRISRGPRCLEVGREEKSTTLIRSVPGSICI